ncbi:MAG TPA: S53 family peptidase [Ktedonobacteraceae bacterium]|nr:S53 family peptidase [Ktedonobacteraceae bacterium]
MRQKIFVALVLVVLLLGSSLLFSSRFSHSAQAEQQLQPVSTGSQPPLVKVSRQLGVDRSNRTLQMSIGLSLRNSDQLQSFLQNLYDPSSASYHQFLSVEQFASEFAPTVAQEQAVINYLTSQGFSITQTYPNRMLIDFSGPQSLAERVFGVSINDYRSPDGREFFANSARPTLPAYLASYVTNISGLDNANQFYHPPVISKAAPRVAPRAGSNCPAPGTSGSGGGGGIFGSSGTAYIPSQFSRAYNYDGLHSAGLQGEGQTVGVFELDGYSQSDITAYTQCFGGGSVPLQNVILDGFNGQPGAGAIEVELDLEMILSQAPHLAKLIVYEAPNTTQGYNDEFARIVSDKTPVISVSWGDCESNMGQSEANQENQYFQEAAAQGQTILVAAGDSGSESCFQLTGGGFNFALNADDPAAQPYVTGVGGTNLTINSDNSYASETVWNGGFLGGAGGGGLSQFWKQPSWQSGPGVQNSYSNGMRETPDVSLDADPSTGYPVYCTAGSSCNGSGGITGGTSGGWITVGGTSAAAPMWAAMVALANEEAAHQGKGALGFLNPALYKIGSGSRYGSDFHDITPPSDSSLPSNNDELGINGGAYPVTNGYDMATGWGSFNAANLAMDLVAMAK